VLGIDTIRIASELVCQVGHGKRARERERDNPSGAGTDEVRLTLTVLVEMRVEQRKSNGDQSTFNGRD
jgi:hypothetical protein